MTTKNIGYIWSCAGLFGLLACVWISFGWVAFAWALSAYTLVNGASLVAEAGSRGKEG